MVAGVAAVVGSRTLALLLIAPALIACNRTAPAAPAHWCEFDKTDERVADSYCLNETRGYEWEPDGDDFVNSHKTHKTSPAKTTTKKPWYKPAPKTTTKKVPR